MTRNIRKQVTKISESTVLPVSLVIVLAGFIYWISGIYSMGQANAASIVEINESRQNSRKEYLDTVKSLDTTLKDMNTRLSHIEGAMKIDTKGN